MGAPHSHAARVVACQAATEQLRLDEAVDLTRTGDVWVFRGRSARSGHPVTTNSPVNHVGMAVVLDDMPPLMWHAELGRSLPDMWTGTHQRGVQLHDLRDAVCVWANRYGQRAWLRQLEPPADPGHGGRGAADRRPPGRHPVPVHRPVGLAVGARPGAGLRLPPTVRRRARRADRAPAAGDRYCAEVVAVTYEAMGLLPAGRDPTGTTRAASGAATTCSCRGARLGQEIAAAVDD